MLLSDYGYGLHLAPNEYFVGDQLRPYLAEMRAMGMSVATTQNKDEYTYRLLKEYGIEPLFRPMLYLTEDYVDLSGLYAMQAAGFQEPKVQPFNEPSDSREWVGWGGTPSNYVELWINRWIDAAWRIKNAGGRPGIQCLDPEGELRPLLQEIKRRGQLELLDDAWMSVHNYSFSHPPRFPYDPINGGAYDVYDPRGHLSFLVPLAFDKVFREELGRSVETWCTEGGWTVGDLADERYPRITPELHRDYTREVVKCFQEGKLPTGEPWPRWWRGFTFWIISSVSIGGPPEFDASAWYYSTMREPSTLSLTIDALKQLSGGQAIRPTFDDAPEPEPPEEEPMPEPTEPARCRVFNRAGTQIGAYNSAENALTAARNADGYIQPYGAVPLDIVAGTTAEVDALRREVIELQGRIEKAKEALS